ncbi:MAG: hypothetical protein JXB32_24845 [Deltaproteobacteria bacterium]|nr:hypothetical protein [Deltaproteobacteria bacterium]
MKKPKGPPIGVGSFFPFVLGPSYEFSPDASEGLRIVAKGIKDVFLANPEATIAAAAFLVGLCSPRYESTCEKIAVESLKALAERQKREAAAVVKAFKEKEPT